jgi:uncharacterized protein (DUF1778 family)
MKSISQRASVQMSNKTCSVERREDRLEIHMPAAAKKVLQRAASSQHKSISAFMLDCGLTAAAEALADRCEFRLSAQQYDAFVAALDAPSKAKRALRDY